MHVANFKARALAVQTARPKGRQPALVRELRKRVGLIDHLRKFAPPEEEVDRAADALGVYQLAHLTQLVRILQAHALLNGAAELEETLAELFSRQLVDRAQAAVAKVIDVVHVTFAAAKLEHVLERVDQVLAAKRHLGFRDVLVELAINAEPADATQSITIFVKELFLEERLRLIQRGRIARTQAGVDLHQRRFMALSRVFSQRIEDQRIADLGHHRHVLQPARLDLFQILTKLRPRLDQLFAALGVHNRRDRVIRRLKFLQLDVLDRVELFDDCLRGRIFLIQRP